MGLWRSVWLFYQKCTLFCLKFSLYYVPNENFNMVISKLRDVCHTQSCDPPRGLEVIWEISNMVIWKLRCICRTQSCDPPRGLEIIWGLKMSKILNLIAYSLAYLLNCTNWVLSCICERLVKHTSRISVALFEMMLASLYILVLVEIEVFMFVVNLLILIFTSFHILAHGYLIFITLWSLMRINSYIYKSGHNGWV
jgi:hypothetical protein